MRSTEAPTDDLLDHSPLLLVNEDCTQLVSESLWPLSDVAIVIMDVESLIGPSRFLAFDRTPRSRGVAELKCRLVETEGKEVRNGETTECWGGRIEAPSFVVGLQSVLPANGLTRDPAPTGDQWDY